MSALRNLQQNFLGYLLDNSAAEIVQHIESTPRRTAEQRMALYGNAYILRLKEALSTDYERLHAYLGDDLFDTLMRQYIERFPSQHTSLRYFGQYLPELTEQLAPFSEFDEIAEIARIEQAFANSFDASDCTCVTLEKLADVDNAAWASLTLQFHTSVQLLPQCYNSFQIWRALANEEMPPERVKSNTTWLIWRQDLVSRYRALEEAESVALTVAMCGGDFSQVCSELLVFFGEQDTPLQAVTFLKQWVQDQMLCGLA